MSPNQWLDSISRFSNGYAKVELNGKQNLIYTNGNITS